MFFRRALFVILSCVFCSTVFADPECPMGYGPTKYTQLEYIKSTGTQYIDTGVEYSTNAVLDLQGKAIASSTVTFFLSPIDSDNYFEGFGQYEDGIAGMNNVKVSVRTTYNISYTSQNMTVNGVTMSSYNVPNDSRISLFGSAYPRRRTTELNMYSVKIYNASSLVFDGHPAKRNSDGTIGIYDTVSETFFTNAGTGDFIAGPALPTEFMNSDMCNLCPPNTYKDFVGNADCTPCPDGLVSPSGSTSSSECGRVLHLGDKVFHLNSVKKTSPALHIRDENGHVWYGNLYSQDQASD